MSNRLQWGRIALAAFLLELAITALVLPVARVFGDPLSAAPGTPVNSTPYFAAAIAGCAGFGFLFGMWGASRASSRFALHGLLVGVTAMLIYFGLCSLAPGGLPAVIAGYGTAMYVLLNALRTLGCWAGGAFVGSRRAAR